MYVPLVLWCQGNICTLLYKFLLVLCVPASVCNTLLLQRLCAYVYSYVHMQVCNAINETWEVYSIRVKEHLDSGGHLMNYWYVCTYVRTCTCRLLLFALLHSYYSIIIVSTDVCSKMWLTSLPRAGGESCVLDTYVCILITCILYVVLSHHCNSYMYIPVSQSICFTLLKLNYIPIHICTILLPYLQFTILLFSKSRR